MPFAAVMIGALRVNIPPTLEKLNGHIALGLSIRPSIRQSVRPSEQILR